MGANLLLIALLFPMFISAGCGAGGGPGAGDKDVLVFSATSLTDALDEIISEFEATGGGEVLVSYGGSQTLAQQIANGAPADIFISAGRFPVDFLDDREVESQKREDLLSNRLVLVVGRGRPEIKDLAELESDEVGRVALAAPDLAPAGGYAKESLVSLGLWDALQRKMVFGADVRATMAYVESGNADVAFVYRTDAAIAGGLEVIDVVPVDSYPQIVYPALLMNGASNTAVEFFRFLSGERASAIFDARGFIVLDEGPEDERN